MKNFNTETAEGNHLQVFLGGLGGLGGLCVPQGRSSIEPDEIEIEIELA